jgi:hypothetical protein
MKKAKNPPESSEIWHPFPAADALRQVRRKAKH